MEVAEIVEAAHKTHALADKTYPHIRPSEIVAGDHIFTLEDSVRHAKFLLTSVPGCITDGHSLQAMRRLSCAQGLLIGAQVSGTHQFNLINKKLAL